MKKKSIKAKYTDEVDQRLDKVLPLVLADKIESSRSQLQRWIEEGNVSVDGKICSKPSTRIRSGARIEVVIPPPEEISIEPEDIPLDILYEDGEVLVLNKQPHLVVHPGAGAPQGTLMHALAGHFKRSKMKNPPERMGLVHRLDKDTTGVMIVCKTDQSLRNVSEQFAARTTKKEYTALVFTTPRGKQIVSTQDAGEIQTEIGRHPTKRIRMAVVNDGGRNALTRWSVRERYTYGALLSVEILTGRTHQIRVHMEHIKSPIVGDPVYGNFSGMQESLKRAALQFGRQALHASSLTLMHPKSKKIMTWHAPIPEDFNSLVKVFRKTK